MCIAFAGCGQLRAQSSNAQISGIVTDPSETIALIVAAKEEKIEEPTAEEPTAEVEVIKKERAPAEGEEETAAEPKK